MLEIQSDTPYFEKDGFQLFQGDSLQLMESIPSESVDMVFADPPYNLSNGGFTCYAGERTSVNKGKWDQSEGLQNDFAFHMRWLKACRRILKPSGTIWVSGSYHSIYACGFALLQSGFKILNDVCWFKPNGAPNLSCRYFTASHETLLWAIKDPGEKHTFHYKEMKHNEYHRTDVLKREDKQMRSVWSISTARGEEKKLGKHPTQKPISLLHRVVLASTNEGDVVFDPFSGSGTTGLAAHKYGRRYIGIETNEEYLDLTIKRFEHLSASMLETPAPQPVVKAPAKVSKPRKATAKKPVRAKKVTAAVKKPKKVVSKPKKVAKKRATAVAAAKPETATEQRI